MKQPTKKQLKDRISDLQSELFRAIAGLPDGELKKRLAAKYPDYFFIKMTDKYSNTNFLEIMEEIGKQPPNNTGQFIWYESPKQTNA